VQIDGAYLLDAGWVFFAAWSLVVLAVGWIAFRQDLTIAPTSSTEPAGIKSKS
jgi:hypothetical protein